MSRKKSKKKKKKELKRKELERASRRTKTKELQLQRQDPFWQNLCQRIENGNVIPIVSNSTLIDQIFDIDGDQILGISGDKTKERNWSIEEQLSIIWAKEIKFPLPEQHWLPRVALFDRVVNSMDDYDAKVRYLEWLKDYLLIFAEEDKDVDNEKILDLRDGIKKYSFSDVATELDYPKSDQESFDSLNFLAKLRLPIYITTSPFNFLERAIIADRREPRTQVCFWSGKPVKYKDPTHKIDYDFEPSIETPLVYHLFGLEDYPNSIVLTEDDYLDFLAHISKNVSNDEPVLPPYLRKALAQSSLILLGYLLRDWDFRVMFKGLLNSTTSSLREFSLAIQLDPQEQNQIVSTKQIRKYLEDYFKKDNFNVTWNTPYGFVEKLWEEWQKWQR